MKKMILFLLLCSVFDPVASDPAYEYATISGWSIRVDETLDNSCFAAMYYEGDSVLRLGFDNTEDNIYMLIGDPSWTSIENGKEYKIELNFGDETPWTANASGFSFDPPENQPYLAISVGADDDDAYEFVMEFMRENSLNIFYNDESILHLSLTGSYKAGRKLIECQGAVDALRDDRNAETTSSRDPFSSAPSSHTAPATVANQAEGASVPIGSGTCFFIDEMGTVLTSNHVLEGSSRIEVISSDGSKSNAKVIKSSISVDTTVLSTGLKSPSYISPADGNSLFLGQDVFTIGYPATDLLGNAPKFSQGTISSLSGLDDDDSWIQMSTPIQPGNSGGPLVNDEGQLVGIVSATAAVEIFFSATGSLPQNVNWAIKTEYIRPIMPPLPVSKRFSTRRAAISNTENSICKVITY